jgi:hypothetical protein
MLLASSKSRRGNASTNDPYKHFAETTKVVRELSELAQQGSYLRRDVDWNESPCRVFCVVKNEAIVETAR